MTEYTDEAIRFGTAMGCIVGYALLKEQEGPKLAYLADGEHGFREPFYVDVVKRSYFPLAVACFPAYLSDPGYLCDS